MTRNSMIDSDKTKGKNKQTNNTTTPQKTPQKQEKHYQAKLEIDGSILIKTGSKKTLILVTAFENIEWCLANSHFPDFPLSMVNAIDVVCLPLLV